MTHSTSIAPSTRVVPCEKLLPEWRRAVGRKFKCPPSGFQPRGPDSASHTFYYVLQAPLIQAEIADDQDRLPVRKSLSCSFFGGDLGVPRADGKWGNFFFPTESRSLRSLQAQPQSPRRRTSPALYWQVRGHHRHISR